MAESTTISGNEKNIRHFERAFRQGKLSHAYIFCGSEGSGKKTLAEYVARCLLCSEVKENEALFTPCGKCPACIKTETGNHPDLIRVTHKKEHLISINEVREQIIDSISVKPYYGPYKIYIIDDADLMNVNAQNALLKTIEEPPSYGLLFLLTENIDALLETVLSRCLKIDMDIIPDEAVKELLIREHKADPAIADAAAKYARGNIGKAIELAEGTGLKEELDRLTEMMKGLGQADAVKINEWAREIESADTKEILDLIRTWFRDVLVIKAANAEEHLYFAEEHITIKDQAEKISFEEINSVFQYIAEAEAEINANVKAEAAAEAMLLKIRTYLARR